MDIKNTIYRGRARTVEDAVEAWKQDYEEAQKVNDIEAIILEWVRMSEAFQAWANDAWDRLRAGKLEKILQMGQMLENAHQVNKNLFAMITHGVRWAQAKGFRVENADLFFHMGDNNKALYEQMKKWPKLDPAEIEKSLACLDRGEAVDVIGWINELQGASGTECKR